MDPTCRRVTWGPWDSVRLHVAGKGVRAHLAQRGWRRALPWGCPAPHSLPIPSVPSWDSRELPASGSRAGSCAAASGEPGSFNLFN